MLINQRAMSHCPSCNFEYEIYCTFDIEEDKTSRRTLWWQLFRHSCALCAMVQLIECTIACVLAIADRHGMLIHMLHTAESEVSTDLRRWWTPYLSREMFYYYAAAVILSMLLLGVASFMLLVSRYCCASARQGQQHAQQQADNARQVHIPPAAVGSRPAHAGGLRYCDIDLLCWSCDCNCVGAVNDVRLCCCEECCPNASGDAASGCSCECGQCSGSGEAGCQLLLILIVAVAIIFIIFGLVVAVLLFLSMLNNAVQRFVHGRCLKDIAKRYAVVDRAGVAPIPSVQGSLGQVEMRQRMQTETAEVMGSLQQAPQVAGEQEEQP